MNRISLQKPLLIESEREYSSFVQSDEDILNRRIGNENRNYSSWKNSPILKIDNEISLEMTNQIEENMKSPEFRVFKELNESKEKKENEFTKVQLTCSNLLESIVLKNPKFIEFNSLKEPPDLKVLEVHYKAKKVGYFDYNNEIIMNSTCPCCHFPINKTQINLFGAQEKISFLGLGYSLYFEIIFRAALCFFAVLLISGLYRVVAIYINCNSNKKSHCFDYFGFVYSTKIIDIDLDILRWLDIISVFIIIISIIELNDHLATICKENNNKTLKPSDFTLMIRNVAAIPNEELVRDCLTAKGININSSSKILNNIKNINFTYRIEEYIEFIRKKENLASEISKLTNINKNLEANSKKFNKNKSRIEGMQNKIKFYEEKLEKILDENKLPKIASSRVLVTFNNQLICRKIIKICRISPLKRFVSELLFSLGISKNTKEKNIIIERAPEPADILWGNLGISPKIKICRRFFTFMISLLMIALGFYVILVITKFKHYLVKDLYGILLSLLSSIIIVIINYLLKLKIKLLSDFEKYSSTTAQEISVAIKLSIMQFINVALVPFVLFLIYKGIYEPKNLLENIFFVFVLNLFGEPLLNFFDVTYFYKLYRRNRIRANVEKCGLNYREASQYFEGPDPQMAEKYALITKNIFIAAFFAPIFPMGLIFCLLSMIFTYCLDKRYAFPVALSEDLAYSQMFMIQFTPLIFSLGNLVYNTVMLKQHVHSLPNYIGVGISCIFLIISFFTNISLNKFSCKKRAKEEKNSVTEENFNISEKEEQIFKNSNISITKIDDGENKLNIPYDEAKFKFFADYDRLNPITAPAASSELRKQIDKLILDPIQKKKTLDSFLLFSNENHKEHEKKKPIIKSIENYAIYGYKNNFKKSFFAGNTDISRTMDKRNSLMQISACNYSIRLNISLKISGRTNVETEK